MSVPHSLNNPSMPSLSTAYTQNNLVEPDTFNIGMLEKDLHETFGGTRVPSSDYVYCKHGNLEKVLDKYCDNPSLYGKTLPMVVTGVSGVGKVRIIYIMSTAREEEEQRGGGMSITRTGRQHWLARYNGASLATPHLSNLFLSSLRSSPPHLPPPTPHRAPSWQTGG
jgi:hypothetical protein